MQDVNLSDIASSVVATLMDAYPERHVMVTIQPGMNTRGDPGLLRVALDNLIGNAWKFAGKVNAAKIGTEPLDERNIYYVRDNGAGFDMEYAHKLPLA